MKVFLKFNLVRALLGGIVIGFQTVYEYLNVRGVLTWIYSALSVLLMEIAEERLEYYYYSVKRKSCRQCP